MTAVPRSADPDDVRSLSLEQKASLLSGRNLFRYQYLRRPLSQMGAKFSNFRNVLRAVGPSCIVHSQLADMSDGRAVVDKGIYAEHLRTRT